MSLTQEIFKEAGLSSSVAEKVTKPLLRNVHKTLAEYHGLNGDYSGEQGHWDLSEKLFFTS